MMSAPIRAGLIIGQLSTGGAEGQIELLATRLPTVGVTPTVYCLSRDTEPYGPRLQRAGVAVRVIAGGRVQRIAQLRRALTVDRIEVAHAWLFIANAYAWAAGRAAPWALVTSARNCKRSGRVLDALNRRAFQASDAIIVNSEQVQHYIETEYGAPRARIAVVYNAIDLERFRPRQEARAVNGPCVAMVGRLVAQKNPALFIAAAAALRERVGGVRFVLIGDGPLRAQSEAAAGAAGLGDCLTFAGERADVDTLLREADLFWLTSDWEGLPNAVLEAMASGLPVVATDVGGTGELVRHGEQGFLVRAGDAAALVEHSARILSDGALHARLRAAARARAEAFGATAMVAATQAVYERARERRAA